MIFAITRLFHYQIMLDGDAPSPFKGVKAMHLVLVILSFKK